MRVVHCRHSDGSCRAFSAWVSAHSLRGSPRCALTLTKKVRAPLSTLSPTHSTIDVMISAFASPASVVRGPLPIQGRWLVGHGGRFSSRVPRRFGSLRLPALRVPLSSRLLSSLWLCLPHLVLLGPLSFMVLSFFLSILGFSFFLWSGRMARRPLFQRHFDAC